VVKGELLYDVAPPECLNRGLAISPDGKSLFVGGSARTLTL
jgi:hypothetical protein